jgi:hypothetical protein
VSFQKFTLGSGATAFGSVINVSSVLNSPQVLGQEGANQGENAVQVVVWFEVYRRRCHDRVSY